MACLMEAHVYVAVLMQTDMINEFTHNKEFKSSLLELLITPTCLFTDKGQPVFIVAPSHWKVHYLRYGYFCVIFLLN